MTLTLPEQELGVVIRHLRRLILVRGIKCRNKVQGQF